MSTIQDLYNRIQPILNNLRDNNEHLIEPIHIRSAVYSTWEAIVLKPTWLDENTESVSYIGIDQIDLKKKIFIGKKNIGSNNVLTQSILQTDTDVFFYNTKPDSSATYFKMSFLAGTDRAEFLNAPYIQAESISSKIDLSIINPSGNLKFNSINGDIIIGNIKYPKTIGNENDILIVQNTIDGLELQWANISNLSITNIVDGMTLTDSRPMPAQVGSIPKNTTFLNDPLDEIVRGIVYVPTPPITKLYITNINDESRYYLEEYSASNKIITLYYNITKVAIYSSLNIYFTDDPLNILPNLTGSVNKAISGPSFGNTYTLHIIDDQGLTIEEKIKYEQVLPFYYGRLDITYTNIIDIQNNLVNLNKSIQVKSNSDFTFLGSNINRGVYILYPASYGDLSAIYDENSINIISEFTKITGNLNSEISLWSNRAYIAYVFNESILVSETFKLKIIF